MEIMTTLRNRAGIFMVAAIVLAIAAFLISDAVQSGQPFMQASQNEIAEISGKTISYQEFDERLQPVAENLKNQMNASTLDASMMGYAVDQAWNQMVSEIVLKKQLEKSGVVVGGEELFDMVQGNNVHPEVRRAFTNPQTGVFNPQEVMRFLQTLDEDETGERRKQWLAFEKSIDDQRKQQKYFNLIKGGMYITKVQAQEDIASKAKTATMQYVLLDYASVSDSAVKITESDLEAYLAANKNKYKQKEEQRTFEYVIFDASPSAADSADAKLYIEEKAAELSTTTDDSLFVALNAETKTSLAFSKKGTLSPMLDTVMNSKSVGYIYGPYKEGNAYKVAKLVAVKSLPDSVKARHILIKPVNGDAAAAKTKADSLVKSIKAGANFADVAKQNSEDPGSGAKGGDLGYFSSGMMVKPFEDACFNGKIGEIQLVQSQFGYHIIQVQDQKNFQKNMKVAVIDRTITPSDKTIQLAFAKANGFLAKATSEETFNATATTEKLSKRVAENISENDKFIAGLDNPREIIRWAFKAEKGDVSTLFDLGSSFIAAQLTAIQPSGTKELAQVKSEIEAAVRVEKKAELLKSKVEGATTLEQAAQKANAKVDTASNVTFASAVIPGVAREPKVIGAAFALKKGTVSQPLKGDRGVYVIKVTDFIEPTIKQDVLITKAQLTSIAKSRVDGEVFEALKDKAEIKDNRAKFY